MSTSPLRRLPLGRLIADLAGAVALVAGGDVWPVLWLFWWENTLAGLVASRRLGAAMGALDDVAWLDLAARTLEAERSRLARRSLSSFDRARLERSLALRESRLGELTGLDPADPATAARIRAVRVQESRLAGGVFGCAFAVFALVHAAMLAMTWAFQRFLGPLFSAFGPDGDPIRDLSTPYAGFGATGGSGFLPGVGAPAPAGPDLLALAPIAIAVVAVALRAVFEARRPLDPLEAEGRGLPLGRLFVMQLAIIFGAGGALFLGAAPLALAFVLFKGLYDLRSGLRSG